MFETNGYLGFTFAGRHSSEFDLLVVSDGSRYHQNSYNQFSDSIVSVPGKNGGYYFGTQLSQRDFEIECVFEGITPHIMHKIQQWLYPNVIGWLIFDEQPYKKYLVKLSSVPIFNFIPFDEFKSSSGYSFQREILKGEVNFTFYTINEYGIYNSDYELPIIGKDELIPQQAIDSGIIPKNYIRKNIYLPHEEIKNIKSNNNFSLYNAGNGISKADFYFTIRKSEILDNLPIEIRNFDDGVVYKITNPFNTIKNKYESIMDNIIYYKIIILGSKQEIYAIGLNSNLNPITDKINIGAHYNHYFPKVYHLKPTEICIFNQGVNINGGKEQLFYTYSYDGNDLGPSDTNWKTGTFEEFQKYWNDYTILTTKNTFNINNIISPATIFIDYLDDYDATNDTLIYKQLGYLIYPNKYSCNYNLISFIAEYDHTYI